jgi:hypothetical protein
VPEDGELPGGGGEDESRGAAKPGRLGPLGGRAHDVELVGATELDVRTLPDTLHERVFFQANQGLEDVGVGIANMIEERVELGWDAELGMNPFVDRQEWRAWRSIDGNQHPIEERAGALASVCSAFGGRSCFIEKRRHRRVDSADHRRGRRSEEGRSFFFAEQTCKRFQSFHADIHGVDDVSALEADLAIALRRRNGERARSPFGRE